MAKFNSEKDNIEFEIKPIEVRDHLCGRYIKYKSLLSFDTKTSIALPDIFDDGNLQKLFASSLDDKQENSEQAYNNNSFTYLNEPVYEIKLNCRLNKREITQLSLFSEDSFFPEQPSLFSNLQEPQPINIINIEIIIRKHFKADCYWEDLIDYVLTQQNLAKIVNSRTKTKLIIGIENGSLNDLLMGQESIGRSMTVFTTLKFTQNLEDFRTSIFQLKDELENIKPEISTFIEKDSSGQKSFDLGPEAKPIIDTRRIKRIEELRICLEKIFTLPKNQQKQALLDISANIEYLLYEEIRKKLMSIFSKFYDRDVVIKNLQSISEELFNHIQDNAETDEALVITILNNPKISKNIANLVLKAKSSKEILAAINRINEESSLKKLLKYII